MKAIVIVLILGLALSGCSQAPAQSPTVAATNTSVPAPTATTHPTATLIQAPSATAMPPPSATATATSRPSPTATQTAIPSETISAVLTSGPDAKPVDPVVILLAAYDLLNNGDVDGFMRFVGDKALFIDPHRGEVRGRDAVRKLVAEEIVPGQHQFEMFGFTREGNVVTFACKVFERGNWVGTSYDGVDVIVDGRILFEGGMGDLIQECKKDPTQGFCPPAPAAVTTAPISTP